MGFGLWGIFLYLDKKNIASDHCEMQQPEAITLYKTLILYSAVSSSTALKELRSSAEKFCT